MNAQRIRFYGVKCTVDLDTMRISGDGFFNKTALNFVARVHQVRNFFVFQFTGKPAEFIVSALEEK